MPTNQYRRLHLNLPSSPAGAAYSAEAVTNAIMDGVRCLAREPGRSYRAFVDMSGGSFDDACLGIAHWDPQAKRAVLDAVFRQIGEPPFDPRAAVRHFCALLREYGLSRVSGDPYGGETFKADFLAHGVGFETILLGKTELYEALEPRLNADEVRLIDDPRLREQLMSLSFRSGKIDVRSGEHDDCANSAAGAIWLCRPPADPSKQMPAPPVIVGLPTTSPQLVDLSGGGYWQPFEREW